MDTETWVTPTMTISGAVEQAKVAVQQDDVETLTKLLYRPGVQSDNLANTDGQLQIVTQRSTINSHTGENLLHFAVNEIAPKTVELLVNPPYCWDPDQPDMIGRTPTQLAEALGYLPIWYPLAARSKSFQRSWNVLPAFGGSGSPRSIAALLINPTRFLDEPFKWIGEVVGTTRWPVTGTSLSLFNKHGEFDKHLTAQNLAFFFELLFASPEVVRVPSTNPTYIWDWMCRESETHPLECCLFPECMFDVFELHGFRNLEPGLQLQLLSDHWLTHRTISKISVKAPGMSTEEIIAIRPISLLHICRFWIRRFLMLKLKELSHSCNPLDLAQTYPSLVAQLPLPAHLLDILSFKDKWPALDRNMVGKRWENKRIKLPHWGTVLDSSLDVRRSPHIFIHLQLQQREQ